MKYCNGVRQFEPWLSQKIGPVQAMPLTPPPQDVDPLTHYFEPYISKLWTAVVQPEILVKAAQHQCTLLLLILPRPMPILSEPCFGLG